MWLKHCPKCGGDLYLDRDGDGQYVSCLQCGRMIYLDRDGRIESPNAKRTRAWRKE